MTHQNARAIAVVVFSAAIAGACSSNSPKTAPTLLTSSARSTTSIAHDSAPALVDLTVKLTLVKAAGNFHNPVAMVSRAGDARGFVAEQYTGKVIAFSLADPAQRATVLDLHGAVSTGNEQGLLGIAFSPDGARLYVDYTNPAGDTQIDEYKVDGTGAAIPTSRRPLLSVKQPFPNHNGGEVLFGPDKMLYIGLGDGGLAGDPFGNGQKRSTLLGKILRIDPTPSAALPYSIPADNPFVHEAGARGEILHYGLRNPWRFSFDRKSPDLWIGDVGQNLYEEIDLAPIQSWGLNFGWNAREGLHAFNNGARPKGAIEPIVEYSHDNGNCSVTGGYVYRGTSIPKLNGVYVYADFCKGALLGLDTTQSKSKPSSLSLTVSQPTSFGEDSSGELYVVSRDGNVWKIIAA